MNVHKHVVDKKWCNSAILCVFYSYSCSKIMLSWTLFLWWWQKRSKIIQQQLLDCISEQYALFFVLKIIKFLQNAAGSFLTTSLDFLEDYQPCCSSSGISSVYEVWSCVLPVGWAVGSLAGATHRGRRKESQSEHHRAVIPLDDEVRRRAARPDSDSRGILRSHAVRQKGGLCRREKVPSNSPTWKQQQQQHTWGERWTWNKQSG